MHYPEFLKAGGTIGLIAPSFGCATEPYISCFDAAKKYFRTQGYRIDEGPNCVKSDGIGKSSSAYNCGEEINQYFTTDRTDIILSCGGGETMCEDLAYVDFEAIRKAKPKWYMGYSDNTNLTFVLPTLCDIATVYGPCAPAFGMNPIHTALDDAFYFLKGQKLHFENYPLWEKESLKTETNPNAPYNVTEPFCMKIMTGDRAEADGRLLGGCMDCLVNLCGTPYDKAADFAERYKEDGIIWFMESCELTPMSFRRALWQMDSCGWFSHVKCFLFGRSYNFGASAFGTDFYASAMDILGKYNVPVIMDLDIGHLPPMMPIVTGAVAHISASASLNNFTIDYKI